jgi:hypothetical protein
MSRETYGVRAVTALHGVQDKPTLALVNALLDIAVRQQEANFSLVSIAHNLNRTATALERIADVLAPEPEMDDDEDDEIADADTDGAAR